MVTPQKDKEASVPASARGMRALEFWHQVTSRCLREMTLDLSSRQIAVLLHAYLQPAPHSIKTLAESLHISKPAICRALDVLEHGKLVKRVRDKEDKRNVQVQRTVRGSVFLTEFAEIILASTKA